MSETKGGKRFATLEPPLPPDLDELLHQVRNLYTGEFPEQRRQQGLAAIRADVAKRDDLLVELRQRIKDHHRGLDLLSTICPHEYQLYRCIHCGASKPFDANSFIRHIDTARE